jgi:hypothetical protein
VASSITTQADLLTYTTVTDNELSRLQTARMEATYWDRLHVIAWAEVKELLTDRRPSVAEDDLDTPSQLAKCTCLMVLYLAYDSAEVGAEDSASRKRHWHGRMRREFARVLLTVNGATLPSEAYSNRRSYRA